MPKTRANGTGTVVKVKTNNWKVIVITGYKEANYKKPIRLTRQGFKTKTDALDFLASIRGKPTKRYKFKELYEMWEYTQARALSDSQRDKMQRAFTRLGILHNRYIEDITAYELQFAVDSLKTSYYPARFCRDVISHVYQQAILLSLVSVNLASTITLPKNEPKEQRPFNKNDISAFWADWECGHIFTGTILIMIYTGLMPGELMQCRPGNVDLKARRITKIGLKTEKRKNSNIVLPEFILPVIASILNSGASRLSIYAENGFRANYTETIKRLGVSDLPPYACRHTTATILTEVENNPELIKEYMRHTNIATTQHYIHVADKQKEITGNKMR